MMIIMFPRTLKSSSELEGSIPSAGLTEGPDRIEAITKVNAD